MCLPLSAYCSPSTLHDCSQLDTCHVQQPCLLGRERKLHMFKRKKGSANKNGAYQQRGEGKKRKERKGGVGDDMDEKGLKLSSC